MAEFSWIDQQAMTSGLTEQERGIFYLQYGSVQREIAPCSCCWFRSSWAASGVDRFLLNDIGIGVLKLLTGGLCGILWLIDIFLIMGKTDDYNRQKAHESLVRHPSESCATHSNRARICLPRLLCLWRRSRTPAWRAGMTDF